ncbi:unnamed protein product [Arctia plantaginis]|uniref:Small ribosomal subunit protein mS40 n=1 Tax=Arctia plantaginis TaxID=874455 RepID=A0A8S0ZIM5_ARCPL|nr:unnamed protein product [Arctia plantaginis]
MLFHTKQKNLLKRKHLSILLRTEPKLFLSKQALNICKVKPINTLMVTKRFGNPCPICRDEYLVLDHRNTQLLEQFISEYTGQILDAFKTGLCQKKHKELLVAIERAWDQGYLTYDVPLRKYDYSLYNKTTNSV